MLGATLNRALRGEKAAGAVGGQHQRDGALSLATVPVVIAVRGLSDRLMPQPTENSLNWWLVGPWVLILTVVTAFEMVVLLRLRRIFAAPLPTIPVRWSPAVTDATLFLGVAMASYGITRFGGGSAPDGHFPWHLMIIFAVGGGCWCRLPASFSPRGSCCTHFLRVDLANNITLGVRVTVAEQPGSGRGSLQPRVTRPTKTRGVPCAAWSSVR